MKKNLLLFIPIVALAFLAGMLFKSSFVVDPSKLASSGEQGEGNVAFYTCSMHPTVQLQDPNAKCPFCAMDLIAVRTGNDESGGPTELSLSPRALKLAEVETTAVERKFVSTEIRMVGKVEYDETRLSYITAWVPGRLDRLYVDYTGVSVKEGDHLVDLYSPDLLSAREELLQAIQTSESLNKSDSTYLKQKSLASIESTKEKLRLWGLSDEQIANIANKGNPTDHITINSPISGIVVHKNALEGMYVETGSQVYTIADLSKVWVKLDAYESDLPWLHYGQDVEFRTEAYPGEVFRGQVAFIDPILNASTRTVKIRVNLPNPDGKLKPDMFVRAKVKSQVAKGGRVMNPNLMGKWISPMHPEIVKNEPGTCDICGMDLVSAESMGYVSADHLEDEAPLVIPASAPLITGKRAVVYVEIEPGRFEGRVIELGPRAGDHYIVYDGLLEGERVVSRGNFKIDSAVQIQAKPSMMNPDGGGGNSTHHHGPGHAHESENAIGVNPDQTSFQTFEVPGKFTQDLVSLLNLYLEIQNALSHDDVDETRKHLVMLRDQLIAMNDHHLEKEAEVVWGPEFAALKSSIEMMSSSKNLVAIRGGFELFSIAMISVLKQFGSDVDQSLFIYHCPMAFNGKGGDWIQNKKGTENPYYGSEMFTCGELRGELMMLNGKEADTSHE
ncbi:efflux RND transporter periplasmic adaptor subunit [bacterium]|nr:efflux RND transporter periplasmic adaptor subunit [bacterium]